MQIISKRIFYSLITPTFSIMLALLFLLWLTQSLRFLDMISARGIDFWMIIDFTIHLIPSFTVVVIPLATAIAIVYQYNKLMCDNEIVILKTMGLNYFEICKPAINYGLIMTIIGMMLSFFISPWSNNKFNDKRSYLQHQYAALVLQESVFIEPVKGLTIYLDKVNKNGIFKGVVINDQRKNNNLFVTAQEARIVKNDEKVFFQLINGVKQELNNGRVSNLYFKTFPFNISNYVKSYDREWREPNEVDIITLLINPSIIKKGLEGKRYSEINNRIFWPLLSLLLAFFASSFMVSANYKRYGYNLEILKISIVIVLILAAQILSNTLIARSINFSFLSITLFSLVAIFSIFKIKRAV
jgi:lipopolysaccharide export system permease protein